LFIEVYIFLNYLFITINNQNGILGRRIYVRSKEGSGRGIAKKSELLMLGKYLNLEAKMLKFEIRNVIVAHLVDGESLYEDALDLVKTHRVDTVKMREIEMQEKIRLKEIEEK
jgi:hypothetical protein